MCFENFQDRSRNVYLSKKERKDALKIPASLNLARSLINQGILETEEITAKMKEEKKSVRNLVIGIDPGFVIYIL